MHICFDHAKIVAPHTQTFWFRTNPKLNYIAGQFVEMTLPHDNPDERGQKRWFTLSSSPTEQMISVTTKLAADRISTFKRILFGLQPGTNVTISEPMGDFVLPKDSTIPLLFVAGGIGVTPVRSMVKWLLDKNQKRNIQIIYGAQSIEDVAFRDLFAAYGTAPQVILSRPLPDWAGLSGQIDAKTILSLASQNVTRIYISGPEPMVEKLEASLLKAGMSARSLVLDYFPGYLVGA